MNNLLEGVVDLGKREPEKTSLRNSAAVWLGLYLWYQFWELCGFNPTSCIIQCGHGVGCNIWYLPFVRLVSWMSNVIDSGFELV